MRRGVLGLLVLGTAGVLVELVVLNHYADANQMIPVAVCATGLIVAAWLALAPGLVVVRVFQFVMLVYAGSAVVGATLHTVGDAAAPVLAPGVLLQLGLLGLLATYRHPALDE